MAGVYRESTRVYRDRADSTSSDEGGYKKRTTVRRYKVAPSRVETLERIERERVELDDDDRRSRYSNYPPPPRTSGEFPYAERPRSAFDSRSQVVERQVIEREREVDPYRTDSRSVIYEKDYERERRFDDNRSVIEVERDRDWDRRSNRPWDHHHHHHHHHGDTEVVVDKRVERREDGDVQVEKRIEEYRDDHGGAEVEKYRKETEYYSPVSPPPIPQPVIIRQKAPEPQQIIVQEAPPPAPIVLPRQEPNIVVLREREQPMVRRDPREDEYYYRRETKTVGRHRDDREYYYDRWGRGYASDEEDYHYKKTIIRRERSNSSDHHHKRHLAEGALAGAGIAALAASRRDSHGELPVNRGSKVLAGAALGGLGTEIIRRARSAYEENYGDDYYDRHHGSRSRSRSRSSRIKTGLGIAAAALAVAGAAKYMQSNKIEKEEATRGRSRGRGYSVSSYSVSRSRSRSRKSRSRSVAKAAAATAAAAGLVKHFRDKSKSKSHSRSRSKSRLRTGAEIAAAGLAGGVASKIYKNRKDKKEREIERELSDEEYEEDLRRERRRSRRRSRSRSQARSLYSEPRNADTELGLVEYGTAPLPSEPPYPPDDGYESAANERRRRRHRDGRDDPEPAQKRSKSRLRDMAAAAVGTGAAAIGIKQYQKKKEKEEDDRRSRERSARSRSRDRSISRDRAYSRDRASRDRVSRDRASSGERPRNRERERDRRRYEDDARAGHYDDYSRPPSPPHASGGSYYPTATGAAAGFTQHPNISTTNLRDQYPPYPQDYGPPMGPSPPMATGGASGYPPPPPAGGAPPAGGPPPGTRFGPDHVSEDKSRSASPQDAQPVSLGPEDGVKWRERAKKFIPPEALSRSRSHSQPRSRSASPSSSSVSSAESVKRPHSASKSVTFIPLSPKSSQTMHRHRREQEVAAAEEEEKEKQPPSLSEEQLATIRPVLNRRRSSSDPSANHPLIRQKRRGMEFPVMDSDSEVEVLPDRFDSHGRPLNGSTGAMRWRQGNFESRPRNGNGWHTSGAWAVGGTDDDSVQKIASNIERMISGHGSWKSLLKDVVGVVQEVQHGGQRRIEDDTSEDEDHDRRRRRRRRRSG